MTSSMRIAAMACALAIAPAAHAMCPFTPLGADVLTPADAALPADGGIVVGWTAGSQLTDHAQDGDDPSRQDKWTADADGKPVAVVLTKLAPGLTVYKPAAQVTGKLTLHRADGAKIVTANLGGGAAAVAMPSPVVKTVKRQVFHGPRWTNVNVSVDVGAVPDDAIALIMSSTGSAAHGLSFSRVPHDNLGGATLQILAQDNHCGTVLGSSEDPGAGARVTFAWVDRAGHVSPASKPVKVGS